MKQKMSLVLYILLAVLMLIDFYLIFNTGNPDSLFRFLVRNPDYDMVLTLGVSALIAFLAFYVFKDRKENPVVNMLKQNRDYIVELRNNGQNNEQIAESFMRELKPNRLNMRKTRKLVMKILEEME